MTFDLAGAADILRRTPAVLDALLKGVGRQWAGATEGPATFSPFEVVGHLNAHGSREPSPFPREDAMIIVRNTFIAKPGCASKLAAQRNGVAATMKKYATDEPIHTAMKGYTDLFITGSRELLQTA